MLFRLLGARRKINSIIHIRNIVLLSCDIFLCLVKTYSLSALPAFLFLSQLGQGAIQLFTS